MLDIKFLTFGGAFLWLNMLMKMEMKMGTVHENGDGSGK